MREREPARVEHHARDRDLSDAARPAVAGVAEERRAEAREVDADLVRAAGLGPRLDEGGPGPGAERPVPGRGRVAARVYAPEPRARGVLSERRLEPALRRRGRAGAEGEVGLLGRADPERLGERRRRPPGAGEHGDAGGLAVEPVDEGHGGAEERRDEV